MEFFLSFKDWINTNDQAIKRFLVFFLIYIILSLLFQAIKTVPKKEIELFRKRATRLQRQKEKNNDAISIKGNSAISDKPKTREFAYETFYIIRFVVLCLVAAFFYFVLGRGTPIVMLGIASVIALLNLPAALKLFFGKTAKTIETITLRRDVLEIELLDKSENFQNSSELTIYNLKDIVIKYNMKYGRAHDKHIVNHYIFITDDKKTKKYYIGKTEGEMKRFKSFVCFINVLKHNADIESLSDKEFKKIIKSSIKKTLYFIH